MPLCMRHPPHGHKFASLLGPEDNAGIRIFLVGGCMSNSSLGNLSVLLNPKCYPHPVERVELLETHISWVFLAGKFAYKIKKPVNLGFVDFSDLAKRQFFCAEEMRLNRRLAPKMYLNVVPLVKGALGVRFGGQGEVFEYAVQMRRFSQDDRLDHMLEKNRVKVGHIDALAALVANFHASVAVAPADSEYGTPEAAFQPVADNFAQLLPLVERPLDRARLVDLQTWSQATYDRLRDSIDERKAKGFVRECHGDLHLANLALIDKKVTAFDCLEFNPSLRWIDVMSEVAFLTMDLQQRGGDQFAARFLDAFLSISGDYAGVALLRFYQVYRAIVRAKVTMLRLTQPGTPTQEREELKGRYIHYIDLAQEYMAPGRPALIIMHGLSGGGKTAVSQRLVEAFLAIRLRSDVERKRLFGIEPSARRGGKVGADIYSAQAGEQTYARLAELASELLHAGMPVIVDAAFLKISQRAQFHQLALDANVPFAIVDCHAPIEILKTRVKERGASDASDANGAVIDHQLLTYEPISDAEWAYCVAAETFPKFDERLVVGEIEAHLSETRSAV